MLSCAMNFSSFQVMSQTNYQFVKEHANLTIEFVEMDQHLHSEASELSPV